MIRCSSAVTRFEVYNEPNAVGYFGYPDSEFYANGDDTIDTHRERCSLYVQMCWIAKTIAGEVDAVLGGTRTVLAGSVCGTTDSNATQCSGVEWIRTMCRIAQQHYGGPRHCFDGITVHPYQYNQSIPDKYFDPDTFKADLDTVRAVMREFLCEDMPLEVTEMGWPLRDGEEEPLTPDTRVADNLGKFYTSALASRAEPSGPYDRVYWYELTSRRSTNGRHLDASGFGLLDDGVEQARLPAAFGCGQLATMLTGRWYNRQQRTAATPEAAGAAVV
jgi:hypothetical protein